MMVVRESYITIEHYEVLLFPSDCIPVQYLLEAIRNIRNVFASQPMIVNVR
jgi:hypothetical protein